MSSASTPTKKISLMLIVLLLGFTAQQFFIPSSITPIRLYMMLVAIGIAWISFTLISGKSLYLRVTLIDFSLTSLYVFMVITSVYADNKQLALQMVIGIFVLLGAFFLIRVVVTRYTLESLYEHILLVAKIFFVWSFLWYVIGISLHYVFDVPLFFETKDQPQVVLYGTYYEGGIVPRFRGICNSPNNFGMYLMLFGPFLYAHSKKVPLWLTVVIILSILLTFSFTTYLSVILSFFIIVLRKIVLGRFIVNFRSLLTVIPPLLIIGFVLAASFLSPLGESVKEFIEFRTSRAETGSGRFELFRFSLELIQESPFFGEGLNQARDLLLPLRELKSTHNNFLEITLEGGIFGLILYIFLILSLLRALSNKYCSVRDRNWIKSTLIGMFMFSNGNVTLYADSLILSLAIISTIASSAKGNNPKNEYTR